MVSLLVEISEKVILSPWKTLFRRKYLCISDQNRVKERYDKSRCQKNILFYIWMLLHWMMIFGNKTPQLLTGLLKFKINQTPFSLPQLAITFYSPTTTIQTQWWVPCWLTSLFRAALFSPESSLWNGFRTQKLCTSCIFSFFPFIWDWRVAFFISRNCIISEQIYPAPPQQARNN